MSSILHIYMTMFPQLQAITRKPAQNTICLCRTNAFTPKQPSRLFSATTRVGTRQRRSMWMWLETRGKSFIDPLPGSTNYLGAYDTRGRLKRAVDGRSENESETSSTSQTELTADRPLPPEGPMDLTPFPLNRTFRSQPVVNEAMREAIWEKVMKDGQSVRTVSAELGVEMSRVGAIVRLKEVEKEWARKGRRLAKPYAEAVMSMLPQTKYPSDSGLRAPQAHESINDLPVHAATMQQIFHPTSESREFTRADAAKAFDETLLPADQRVPHPELAELERDRLAGVPYRQRVARAAHQTTEAERRKLLAEQLRRERDQKAMKIVPGNRWDFKFREISVEGAGPDGRGHKGTGWRYGVPHMDRRRGEVKIPTRVL